MTPYVFVTWHPPHSFLIYASFLAFQDSLSKRGEIGDECDFVLFTATNAYGDPLVYRIGDKLYATQPEYSNALHGCAVH